MLATYPMHGQHKLSREGYRTRDGHLIEWFGRLVSSGVCVFSRPEPTLLKPLRRYDSEDIASNTKPVDKWVTKVPTPWNTKKWWVDTADLYPVRDSSTSACVAWNPLLGLSYDRVLSDYDVVVLDLLDDWTSHYAYKKIGPELERAYGKLFDRVSVVTANSEGTASLARRFGRSDVKLLLNGCDPERFSLRHNRGCRPTVGYVGKIGYRLDLDAIETAASRLPDVKFVFAGPVLDRSVGQRLRRIENVELLGDVHYSRVPALFETFDIGWVPHGLGKSEVGGDVIKTYEYRAAGLPVLTTPVIGAGKRGLTNVHVQPGSDHGAWIGHYLDTNPDCPRVPEDIPPEHTWQHKAREILADISARGGSL